MLQKIQVHIPLVIAFLIAPCLACSILAYLPVAIHNNQLKKFANNLYTYPLPEQTIILSRQGSVSLRGNGNHCDFYVEQVMSTKLSRDEVEAYYQDVKLPGVGVEHDTAFVHVNFDDAASTSKELIFEVNIIDFDNPTNLDYRCH